MRYARNAKETADQQTKPQEKLKTVPFVKQLDTDRQKAWNEKMEFIDFTHLVVKKLCSRKRHLNIAIYSFTWFQEVPYRL